MRSDPLTPSSLVRSRLVAFGWRARISAMPALSRTGIVEAHVSLSFFHTYPPPTGPRFFLAGAFFLAGVAAFSALGLGAAFAMAAFLGLAAAFAFAAGRTFFFLPPP